MSKKVEKLVTALQKSLEVETKLLRAMVNDLVALRQYSEAHPNIEDRDTLEGIRNSIEQNIDKNIDSKSDLIKAYTTYVDEVD